MVEAVVLKAERREKIGTRFNRKLREQGLVPAIIYGHKKEPVAIQLNAHDLSMELHHHQRLLKIELDGKVDQLLVKEVQYDHFGLDVLHIDLTRVDMDERVTVEVVLSFKGTAAGETEGGVVEHALTELEIECPVASIPDEIRVMVTDLQLNDTLLAKDVELPDQCTLVTDGDTAVATVKMPVEIPEEEEGAEEGEAAEPEVIGGAKEEETEG